MNKTTKKHFAIFQKECEKWIEIFGLKGWEVCFEHEEEKNKLATINYDVVGRLAIFTLSTYWKRTISNYELKRSGFHEVCELLLGRLNIMITQRYDLNEQEQEEEIHAIVRTLENVMFKKKNP